MQMRSLNHGDQGDVVEVSVYGFCENSAGDRNALYGGE